MNQELIEQKTEAGILARLIQATPDGLSRDAANYLLSVRLDDRDIGVGKALQAGGSDEFAKVVGWKSPRTWTPFFLIMRARFAPARI